MHIRCHRGSLADAMETLANVQDYADVKAYLTQHRLPTRLLRVEWYDGPDDRIGWPATYIVLAQFAGEDHVSPVAFTDEGFAIPADAEDTNTHDLASPA